MTAADVDPALQRAIYKFELSMRSCTTTPSREIALSTIRLFFLAVDISRSDSEVESNVRHVRKQLRKHFPLNLIIGNVCGIVKKDLWDELPSAKKPAVHRRQSFLDIWKIREHSDAPCESLKSIVKEGLDELQGGLENAYTTFAKLAKDFLVSSEVVLTLGVSRSVVAFLSKHRPRPTVVVLERAPEYDGWTVAKNLERVGAEVIVIPDSAIFAILPKITKVIVSAHAVLANGGIVSYSLTNSIALAAKHHSKPFIALYWRLKLSKTMPGPRKVFTSIMKPVHLLQVDDQNMVNSVGINPDGDYVPPELITVLINGDLSHCPGDVFSLVQGGYYSEDASK
jgi:translation initiation factor eIF-2B subunit beta